MKDATNLEHTDPYKHVGDSIPLLSKYDIPISHLDFSYIEKCQEGRELEKIFHVLKSGEEGYYPDLMKAVETKLKIIYPKSKFLRNVSRVLSKEEVEDEEWTEISKDLNEWMKDVSKDSRELELRKGQKTPSHIEQTNIRKTEKIAEEIKIKPQKIKSTDYAAWDKYDPDAELLEMTLEEEKLKKEAKSNIPNTKKKKKVKFNMYASEVEAKSEAKAEKEKGNEYFKAGDFTSALRHYSDSLECIHTVEAFNNRAMTYLKLEQYEDAIKDCDSALGLEPSNLKAHWRKSMALDGLGRFDEALDCIEICVDIDPNNEKIQNLANSIRKKSSKKNGFKRRMLVENVVQEEEKKTSLATNKNLKALVPIPGTSRMPEPSVIECNPEDMKMVTNILYLKRNEQEIPPRFLDGVNRSITSHDSSNNKQLDRTSSREEISHLNDLPNSPSETEKLDKTLVKQKSKKLQRNSMKNSLQNINLNDENAGGEPHRNNDVMILPQGIHSPYEFLKTWNNIRDDATLKKQAHLIRNMNMEQIVEVIGCKLDNNTFSIIIRTLCTHFTVPGEVEKVYSVMLNFARLPRFEIISMLMSEQDRNCVNLLISFLQQHDKVLPENVMKILAA